LLRLRRVPRCTIEGVQFDDGAVNPGDFCEVCNAVNPTSWTPRFHPDCPPPCIIDDVYIAYGTANPLNECEECDGGLSDTSWSFKGHNTRCGSNQDQLCCQGVCCEPGACCTPEGSCAVGGSEVCDGCDIDGNFYPNGERNPATVCQICEIDVSTTSWTNDDFWPCNDIPHRSCCHGVCCMDGEVCRNANTDGSFCG
jgi:hypothetical protein